MATISTPVSSPPKRLGFWRVTAFFLIILVLAALGAVAWLYSIARSALPQLDGTVQVPGLAARVKVTRDAHGVPTIDAARLDDLFFAQGYVTAQDRLWQMDAMRRFAAGELSEILGEDFLEHDREQRILGLRAAARKAIEVTSEQDRSRFEAYARGVNAYIDSHRKRLPLEFRILRYSPRAWTPEDSALIAVQMVKDLNHYPYKHALAREQILAKLGPELTADLYVNSSWHDRPPTVSRPGFEENRFEENTGDEDLVSGPDSSVAGRTGQSPVSTWPLEGLGFPGSLLASEVESDPLRVLGSNNWVVSGAHTVTGKPLLSNDMHLAHQMPNLWYEAHL
ncbi:MAG TPA: penicillin acylase family protein, partial [Terriglobales bacterium]|nr:penicillin acylase family protein [Terriglobales bacterium]